MKGIFTTLLPILLLAAGCASDPTASPKAGERYALIETGASRRAEGIFPVLITEIDDRRITITGDDLRYAHRGYLSGRSYYRVHPGRHVIRAMGVVDRAMVPGLSRDSSRSNSEPLEANFQAGKRYFVGVKADSGRRADWRLVIWKVEDIEEGTLKLGEDD